ncbi:MAG: Threonine dehydrogenase and related Zn-dependent dehydrogenases, partial [uncultured Friedmanniella sp.]
WWRRSVRASATSAPAPASSSAPPSAAAPAPTAAPATTRSATTRTRAARPRAPRSSGGPDAASGLDGMQAEYLRVPFARVSAVPLPDSIDDDQAIMLS